MPPDKKKQIRRVSMSPEEILAKQFRAKCRFKAAVCFVIQNLYWLEDFEDQELGDDVQKNIVVLTRKKEQKSLLSLSDKAILNVPAELRTDAEKEHLNRVIGGLKCFRRYPGHVKKELAGVTYFVYYGPGRMIVRQGDMAHALYFIITGEVAVSQIMFDPIYNRMVKHDVGEMGPGDMFGEVSLLHDIPRTATVTTLTHCEMLCLKKPDFGKVLKGTVKKQWDEVKESMRKFSYFEEWHEITIRECCILSKMKYYKPDDTILGDGHGLTDHVYFVLKGKCKMIEQLYIKTDIIQNKKYYSLYQPTLVPRKPKTAKNAKKEAPDRGSVEYKRHSREFSKEMVSRDLPLTNIPTHKGPVDEIAVCIPKNVEIVFMQICFMNEKATFGIGENFKNRRIVAITDTQCLLIPHYWLMQKNNGNIWNKVQQFLNNHVPKTKQVFQEFVASRRWLDYRKRLVDDILDKRMVNNDNIKANIPYFIRVNEDVKFP